MPRKTSQRSAAIAESKNEGNAPRRSGRATTKQEITITKEASRSRRSSTAAQTAASVADSRAPRSKGGSRRESTSPSDSRSRTGGETPATRVKSTRRSTGRINYKESDGEEEVPNTKFDENFESGDDLEESESDEKSKTRGRSRSTKAAAKTSEKSKATSRSRRGRPSKKKEDEEDEENETFDVSDDSNEPEEVPLKRGRAVKEKEPAKSVRNRRQKSEVTEVKSKAATEDKSRQTRRSGRGSTNKEDSPKKRPMRGVQAKRYAEDDDDEIEEISDSKADDDEVIEMKESEGRKRKRGASPEEANKRLKDASDEHGEEQSKELEEKEEKQITEKEKESMEEKKFVEEPMEIDASDSAEIPETEKKADEPKEEKSADLKVEEKVDQTDKEPVEEIMDQKCTEEKMEHEDSDSASKEKKNIANKQEDMESSSKDENIESSDSEKKIELSSSEMNDVKEADKVKATDTLVDDIKIDLSKAEKVPEPISQAAEQKSEKDNLPPAQPPLSSEANLEKSIDNKPEPPFDTTVKDNNEILKSENVTQEEKNVPSIEETTVPSVTPVPATPPKESITDTTLNGAEQSSNTQNSTHEVLNVSTPNVNFDRTENNTPKANGAHNDVQHTNSPLKDQYCLLPGRKYVINSKLNENLRQNLKNKMFGFVSFNLGTPDSDAYLQKDKLLNELSKLDANVICLQQVAKPFYNAVLEPSLDALGFKSIFSQPQDSLKGVATFYKSSLFRLSGKSDISLRELVEKEIEASPLDSEQKAAVKSHIRRCGSVLFTHFSTVIGTQTITVANVQIPRSDFSSHALQISCLAQEVIRINGGTNKPLILGGEFNIAENDASYQLLRDGYLSNEMIEELQQRKDVVLPDNKDHEFIIPELKTASPDLLWFSSDSLHTVGVLDVVSDKTGDHHLSLKADIAFSI
ncbi:unnamed protein product [Larinioides sclopetarius]|uniref:Endonuclease/exonuclease/phosphatase domain-containing protein n=1 Tax=Larinioides sclopetarius TaxID=280406 RepID=A0AAV2AYZ8_9ARAC